MLFIQKICAAAVVPLVVVMSLIIDAHPWAAVCLLLCAMACGWVAVQDPPPPVHRKDAKLYRWRDTDTP